MNKARLKTLFKKMAPTGSRFICNPPPRDTDEDYVCLSWDKGDELSRTWNNLEKIGFKTESLPGLYQGNEKGGFRSWRMGEINLIVTADQKFYDLFVEATGLAKKRNLLNKKDRIALFQSILYGVDFTALEMEDDEIPW